MGDQDGSKAMTVYIVACFVLALGALVLFKFQEDKRDSLSGEVRDLTTKFADMHSALALNIRDYYRKVAEKQINPIDDEVKDNTDVEMRRIAEKLGITSGVGKDDHLDINEDRRVVNKLYIEYSCTVKLKQVSQAKWAVFLSQAQYATREYAVVQNIDLQRADRTFQRMKVAPKGSDGKYRDDAMWDATITFVWFGPLNSGT